MTDTETPSDALTRFLLGDAQTRRDMADNPDYEADLVAYLGRAGLDRYRALQPAEHLALDIAPNVLFVPGVMGSVLMNERLGGIWWVDVRTRSHIDDLGLKADGSGDALTGSLVKAIVPDTSYEPNRRVSCLRAGDVDRVDRPRRARRRRHVVGAVRIRDRASCRSANRVGNPRSGRSVDG